MPSSDHRPGRVSSPSSDRPAVVDEWGLYDPDQAGLAALFDRVEEKRRGAADPDAGHMAASMQEANRLAEANASSDEPARRDDDETAVRGSGRAFLP